MASERPQSAPRTLRGRWVVRRGELVEVPLKREPDADVRYDADDDADASLATHATEMVPWFSGLSAGPMPFPRELPALEPARLPRALMAGPIIGWRLWRVTKKAKLQSLSYGHMWQPGKPMVGDPRPGNSHGVYAMKARGDVDGFPTAEADDTVVGEVALWGRIIEHEHGYRAQFGYPLRLHMRAAPPMPNFPMPGFPRAAHGGVSVAEALHQRYGIEVLI